jgi:hypothetical protein
VDFGLDCGQHAEDRLVSDVFRKMLVAMDSHIHKPPEGRQIAVAQPLHRRRISASKSLHEFGIFQNRFSPVRAAIAGRVSRMLSHGL